MKIAFLTPEFITEKNWHGGLANYLGRVTEGLSNRGHDISIFVLSDREGEIKKGEVSVYRIKFRTGLYKVLNMLTLKRVPVFLKSLILSHQLCKKFKNIDKTVNFDVIQSSSYLTPAVFLFSKKHTKRLITRISSITKLCRDAYKKGNKLDSFFINMLELRELKKSIKSYSPSIISQRILMRDFNVEVDLIEPPYYFKEIDEDESFFLEKLNGKDYFLFFGSLGRLKGVDIIADDIYEILRRHKNYYFVFVGKDMGYKNSSMIDYVRNNAKEFSSRVLYFESIKHEKLFPVIRNSRVVILPSRIDNLPNTLIESMSLGKIVVGTYDGGFDQLIEDEKNGFLFNVGDSVRFLEVLNRIVQMDEQETLKYEEEAKRSVKSKLDYQEKIIDLENYFMEIINRKDE